VCSKNCCATQWPVPINLTEKSRVDPSLVGTKYFTSNLTCNNAVINTGCVCLTSESKKMLGNRGYVKELPMGNGLFEQDNRKSVFKILEDQVPRPMNAMGQTTELTGVGKEIIYGKLDSRFDNRVDKYRSVESEKEIAKYFTLPINNNIITFNNNDINEAQVKSISSRNIIVGKQTGTERLLSNRIGIRDQSVSVSRK